VSGVGTSVDVLLQGATATTSGQALTAQHPSLTYSSPCRNLGPSMTFSLHEPWGRTTPKAMRSAVRGSFGALAISCLDATA